MAWVLSVARTLPAPVPELSGWLSRVSVETRSPWLRDKICVACRRRPAVHHVVGLPLLTTLTRRADLVSSVLTRPASDIHLAAKSCHMV